MVLPQDSYLRFGPYLDLMTGIRTALNINEGIIKVVAPEGCGKTALCRQLANDLVAEGQEVIFFETPPESVEFLHKRIQSELNLPRDKNFTRTLTNYLLAKSPPQNKLILIYDDAEKISKELFILIRLLNNIHDASDTLVSQVICGTNKLDRVFDDPDLRSLTQYLNQSFTLPPMDRDELEDFYSGYKKQAGITGRDMSNKELTDLFKVSKGMPGIAFELLGNHFSKGAAHPLAAKTGSETSQAAADSPAEVPPQNLEASLYAREVDEILDEDDHGESFAPVYFKVVLSAIVVVATIVLAVVLSGDNEAVNNRLAEILADDSPLYLDEVAPEDTPVTGSDSQTETVTADIPDNTPLLAGTDIPPADNERQPAEALISNAREAVTATTNAEEVDQPVAVMTTPANGPADIPADAAVITATGSDVVGATDAMDTQPEPVLAQNEESLPGDGQTEEPVVMELVEPAAAPPPAPATDRVLGNLVQDWLDAWQSGDYAGYLAAYHDAFESAYHDSRGEWESERESRIDGVTGIDVSYDRFELLEDNTGEATVRFWLYYSRGSYADETLKEIIFRRENGEWLILSERNLELIVR